MTATSMELREDIARFWGALKESERIRELAHLELAQAQQKTAQAQQELAQAHRETEQAIKELSQEIRGGVGGLRNTIGHIIEMVLLPGLSMKINELGHQFTRTAYRNEFKRADGTKLAEVDLFLENGAEVMVVEAKTLFNGIAVEDLLTRVKKLRDAETQSGMVGKTIYAAAAGVDFTEDARRMIEENGIYSVKINEENDKIVVGPIHEGKVGKW